MEHEQNHPLSPSELSPLIAKRRQHEDISLKKLSRASVICFIFMIVEFTGGWIANSLAIMTDATHLLSDIISFVISITAIMVSRRAASYTMSFGFHRAEILGATLSVFMIWGVLIYLLYAATIRLITHDSKINGKLMFIIASFGLGVNIGMAVVLGHEGHSHGHSHSHDHEDHHHEGSAHQCCHSHHDHGHTHADHEDPWESHAHTQESTQHDHGHTHEIAEKNLNLRAAFIHVIGDFVQSVGVLLAAGMIWYNPKYWYMDPLCTYLFSILVVFTTVPIFKESVLVLMESTPRNIIAKDVEASLLAVPGVCEVHDLHIWSIGSGKGKIALAVHISQDPRCKVTSCDVLHRSQEVLFRVYGIDHSTIQVENCQLLECGNEIQCGQSMHTHRSNIPEP